MGRKKSRNRKLKTVNKTPAKAAVSSSAVPPPWIELPRDVTGNILQRLGAEEILKSAQRVCSTWWKVCKDPAIWRVIYLFNPELLYAEYSALCRRAVDRSQGQLVDLTLDGFGDGQLINYVADRSSHLKRLTLESCYDICGESLAEAAKKLPHLEELHLTIVQNVLANDVETIGISCPKLKSFSYNSHGSMIRIPTAFEVDDVDEGYDWNGYALAIGNSMPNLRHLKVFANHMRNEGLEAILDGCPLLESLDIRLCFGLDLAGDLGKRCREQIKDVKLPSDSITSDVSRLADDPSEWFHYSNSNYSDDDYYDEYETYDDYFSPTGFGYFDNDLQQFYHPWDPEFR